MTDSRGKGLERREAEVRLTQGGASVRQLKDHSLRRGLVFTLLILTLYLCLTLIITHPLWLHLTSSVPGDIGDPLLNTWILAWDAHALLTDPLHLFDANIFYPLPNTLAYSEHLLSTAMLVLPLTWVSGEPVLGYNLGLLLSFPLAGLGMYLLTLFWTGRRGPALLAGLAFAFAPYRLASIAHLQLLTVQWLPFSLLALDRLLSQGLRSTEHGTGRTGATQQKGRISSFTLQLSSFVIFTSLQILASWYLAVFSGLVLGLYVLVWLLARSSPKVVAGRGWGLIGAVVLVAGFTTLLALPYLEVLPELQAARPVSLAASFAAWPTDYLIAPSYLRIAGPLMRKFAERPGFTEENALFPGIVGPLLALIGLTVASLRLRGARRGKIIGLGVILVTSLALTFGGPYQALTRLLPALTVVRVPPRWVIPATFALAALAGYGAAWLGGGGWAADRRQQEVVPRASRRRSGWRAPAVYSLLFLLLFAESFAAPLPLARVGARDELPPVYYALREVSLQEPGEWAVVELPMHVAPAPEFPETKRLYASTLGWWGLVNGYSGFTPAGQMALGQVMADFPGERALEAVRTLGAAGVRYLVIHPGEAPLDRERWEEHERWQVERQASLLPLGDFGPDGLYLINPYGEGLITQPDGVGDAYWSSHKPSPVDVRFKVPGLEGELRLLAYLLTETRLAPELRLTPQTRLTLYWQATGPLGADYTVFVHSLGAGGELIGQADSQPVANHYPTSGWRPEEIVQDSRPVLAGDRYLVGLYHPATGERLPAFTPDGSRLTDDAVILPDTQP